ncbi:MAG: T9SS type A sorting domain-containing protein, partial [Bacteroidetes bacterium]|nr:T9SS type A sorting domain-containing protein [Bacteroidota bacterium]
ISTPLPIELLSFGVSPQGHEAMEVRWSTASEQDNALFTIERAADTATWEAIAQLPGAGNSNAVIAYAWTDGTPLDGTSYYRLKQTDTDGTSTWSDIVPVVRTAGDALRVFPNPAEDHASVRTSLPDGPLYLLDGLGRPVGPAIHLRSGAADLDLSALPPGMYFLRSSDPRSAPWPLMVH